MKKIKRIAYMTAAPLAFFLLWEFSSRMGLVPRAAIPPPSAVLKALADAFVSGELPWQTLLSLSNIGIGFLLGLAVNIPFGLFVGMHSKRFERWLLPFARTCEKLNPFALFPIFILLFGIGRLEKVMIVLWVSQWPLFFSSIEGAKNLDATILKSAKTMGASGWKLTVKVVVPLSLPYIFTGVKTSAQLAFFMIIASEMVGASEGLGYLFLSARHAYSVPLVYGIILYITVLSILINLLFTKIERWFSRYKPEPVLSKI